MATTSITPDMEANVTGIERAEEQRFQHARDCEGNHDSDNVSVEQSMITP